MKKAGDQKFSEADLQCRRDSWRAIHNLTSDKSLPDREKLRQCLEVASVYAAMTGDESLFPPVIQDGHGKQLEWLMCAGEKIKKLKEAGQESLLNF